MCHFGKIVVYRSPPGTHQACNQQAGLQPQVAGDEPGVERCRSPRVNSQKKKTGQRRNASMPCSSPHFFRSFPQRAGEREQGLIVGPLPRFLSRPESLFASLFCPSGPSVPSNARHTRTHTNTHTKGPCRRAMPSPSKNEVTHSRHPNLVEPRLATPPVSLSPLAPTRHPPFPPPRPPTRGNPFQRNGQQSTEPTCRALSPV